MNEKKERRREWRRVLGVLFFTVFNPIIALLIAAIIILLPIKQAYDATLGAESVYDHVFVAALGDKCDRLYSVKEPKIAVVGGSSVAFGLDSAHLSRYTSREVVNFGLYATLGSKVMLDLSEGAMNAGDIVVFAPEPDAETMSLYFGADAVWQAIDVEPDLIKMVAKENRRDLYDSFEDYRAEKAEYLADGKPNPPGVYNRASFNALGDIAYPRPYNIMAKGYDSNTLFSFDTGIISRDFLDYFNAYATRLGERGVTVYFSFCPVNEFALAEGVDEVTLAEFQQFLEDNLVCPVISDIDDYIMDWGYFYDTNMHLNDAGVRARTNLLIEDIRRAEGVRGPLVLEYPEAPGKESGNEFVEGDNTYFDYFVYRDSLLGDGLEIVGVTELARANTDAVITLPYHNGEKMIISIEADVLGEIPNLVGVRFGENISSIADGVFRGCESLTDVYLEFGPNDCAVSIPERTEGGNPDGFLVDAPNEIRIHATKKEEFNNHYTWGDYYDHFVDD